ncbi:MAG: hypothetical protein CVV64_15285 [Candidatus Wallbacteria bacterium HGW-Wallbacteria-1]|uniref:Uncharacterized protein n=1 Tax=Candidatus Wallbacteria bacterium HGW-Wallbacteria-1 TaxID=2013854 RepID=A0A2N1PLR7_9BACT|nr:MAG: hypothetical protein CVV64_15285 [Candidatus Wallbacteria bacterium HGW-Wallbacteria-1]
MLKRWKPRGRVRELMRRIAPGFTFFKMAAEPQPPIHGQPTQCGFTRKGKPLANGSCFEVNMGRGTGGGGF